MFNKIINNTLLISGFAMSGGLVNYLHNVIFKNKYEKYYKQYNDSLICNNGFLLGGLIGIAYSYFKCPHVLNTIPQLKN